MRYIEELKEGEKISDIYLCKQKQILTTKNGKAYESLILQDKQTCSVKEVVKNFKI